MSFRLFFCLSLLAIAYGDCVIMTVAADDQRPVQAIGNYTVPQMYGQNWTGKIACPEFQNVPSCCNDMLNQLQVNNFARLGSAFGNTGAGCDVCSANLQRFFCTYSCSPNQSDWMVWEGVENVTLEDSDTNELKVYEVAVVSLNMSADMACGVFQSCSKVSFMTEISAGSSALGFLTFMFDRGTTTSYTKDLVSIVNEGGMSFNSTPPHSCNETFPSGFDQFNYSIPGSCPCNYCADSCSPLTLMTYGSLTDGFKATNVLLTYMFAVLLTVGCAFVKGYRKRSMNKKIQQRLYESSRDDNSSIGQPSSNYQALSS